MNKLQQIIDLTTAILRKKEEELETEFSNSHYERTKEMVETSKSIQDGVEEIINEYRQNILDDYKNAPDKAYFMNELRRRMKEDDDLFILLFAFLSEVYPEYVRREVVARLKKEVPKGTESLRNDLFSLYGIYDSLRFARLTARTKADGVTGRILDILQEDELLIVAALTDDKELNRKTDSRRTAIESTETLYHIAQQEAARQNPYIIQKKWIHEMNEKLHRRGHIDMNGVTVGKNEKFELRGVDGATYECMFPRDPSLPITETIRCHCQMETIKIKNIPFPTASQEMAVSDADLEFRTLADDESYNLAYGWKQVNTN